MTLNKSKEFQRFPRYLQLLKEIKMTEAIVTEVKIGPLTIQGLMSEDGEFGVAVPQIAATFSFLIKNASRDVKALLGGDSPFLKNEGGLLQWKTELNSKAVGVLTLPQFTQVLRALDKKGNKKAQVLVDALVGLSLHQIFCDAFGLAMGPEERQEFLEGELESLQGQLEEVKLQALLWEERAYQVIDEANEKLDAAEKDTKYYSDQLDVYQRKAREGSKAAGMAMKYRLLLGEYIAKGTSPVRKAAIKKEYEKLNGG